MNVSDVPIFVLISKEIQDSKMKIAGRVLYGISPTVIQLIFYMIKYQVLYLYECDFHL